MSKSLQTTMNEVDQTNLLASNLERLHLLYGRNTSKPTNDFSLAEDQENRRGRLKKTRRHSLVIEQSQRRNSYSNPHTGEQIEWVERPLDEKVVVYTEHAQNYLLL